MIKRLYPVIVAAFFVATGCTSPETSTSEDSESAGPAAPAAAAAGTFVGVVDGSDALIGLVSDGNSVAGLRNGRSEDLHLPAAGVDRGGNSRAGGPGRRRFRGGHRVLRRRRPGRDLHRRCSLLFRRFPRERRSGVYWQASEGGESGWVLSTDGESRGVKSQNGDLSEAGAPQGEPFDRPELGPVQAPELVGFFEVLEVHPVGHHPVASPGQPVAGHDLDQPGIHTRLLPSGFCDTLKSKAAPQACREMPLLGSDVQQPGGEAAAEVVFAHQRAQPVTGDLVHRLIDDRDQ